MHFHSVAQLFTLFVFSLITGCAHHPSPQPSNPAQPLAEINGHAISEAELELYLQTLPQDRQKIIRQDPNEHRKAFEELLSERLYTLAAKESEYPFLDSLHRRVFLLDQGIITQFYLLTFIGENLGITRQEIAAFYRQNPKKFRDSSGNLPPLNEIMGRVSDTMALMKADLDSFYRANAANYPPNIPNLRQKLAENYLFQSKQVRSENAGAELKAKYQARLVNRNLPTSDSEIADYYTQNKASYFNADGFDLYHIETRSEKTLASKVAALKTLNAFKALASRHSENHWTKPLGGRVGCVKRDHCLPYGIGTLPALFPLLDAIDSGKVSLPLQNPVTGKWHYFWLEKKTPPSIKPLDRVKAVVKQDILTNRLTQMKPDDTLAVIPGRRVIFGRDVSFLRGEYPNQIQDIYTRENLAHFLMEREVIMAEAESLGLLDDERVKASRLENELTFWSRFYLDTLLGPSWNPDTAAMKSLFAQKQRVFAQDSQNIDWRPFAKDLAAYPLLKPEELKLEYQINRELYLHGDSLPPFGEVEYKVFHQLKSEAYRRLDTRRISALKERFKVRIHPSLGEPIYEPADKYLKQAKGFHRDRKPVQALFLYERLRDKFLNRDSLQYEVGMGIAQIHLELKHYQRALAEYRRLGLLYPQNPDNYKALFMEGFIQAEHFKNDSAAVRILEDMLKKYPGSSLTQEADWMIRHIRSGGTLMPELKGSD